MEIPIIARVECRSEGTAEEGPVALWIGGSRLLIKGFVDNIVMGSPVAGEPIVRRLTVETDDEHTYRLDRTLPDGEWKVMRLVEK